MPKILDQYGNPIDSGALREPQTSRIAALENQYLTPMLSGLTPERLARHLRSADDGDLTAQARVFSDMEDRSPHVLCEINKRKLAVMGLDWDIVPPRNATAAEKANAEWVKDVLKDAVDPIEDLILALMDGVGHGFAPVELEWRVEGREWLPSFHPRPQEWLRLDRSRRQLRLIDSSPDGAPLQPFGWVVHTHGKPKTGYLGRAGLHRTIVWPFLYMAYALGDGAELLETWGLPIIIGKYFSTATADEKASLLRAIQALGHDARAIMPKDMEIELLKVTGGGDGLPHMTMVDWAERAISKAILGQTMSAEAKSTGIGSGNADLHGEVRDDIRNADARQIAATATHGVIYPLLALNRGGIDSLARCPRLVFDTGEAEDLVALGKGVGELVKAGVRTIPVAWVHEKSRIPLPQDGEATLGALPTPPENKPTNAAALAALAAAAPSAPPPAAQLAGRLAIEVAPPLDVLIAEIRDLVFRANSLDELRDALLAAYADLPSDRLTEVMALGFAVADLAGRDAVKAEL